MRAVNLSPKHEGRSARSLPSPWIVVAAFAPILAIVIVILLYSHEQTKVQGKQAELTAVQKRLDTLQASGQKTTAETGFVSVRASWEAALQDAMSKQMPWDVTLDDLARVLPSDVWLTALAVQTPTPANVAPPAPPPPSTTTTTTTTTTAITPVAAPPVNPTALTMTGYASSNDEVATVLARLRLLPMLSNVTLGSTGNVSGATGKSYVTFSLTASIQHPPTGTGL